MKSFISILILLFISSIVSAQDCKNFFYLTRDAKFEITLYDGKSNEIGKQEWKIDDLKNDGTAWSAKVKTKFTDKKGRDGAKAQGVYKCIGGTLNADIKMSLPQEQMQAFKNMDVKGNDAYLEYPVNLMTGQVLRDANYKMETWNKGSLVAIVSFNVLNRKVEGKETVTTPAGTWEAYKINYNSLFKVEVGSTGRGIPMNFKITEWFVPGYGIVKSETYNNNGKLVGSSQLTSLKLKE
jgi:hypothetical protein